MKNNKRGKLSPLQKISNAVELPIDMAFSGPYIKLCGNREILVESAGKLVHYDMMLVKVRQNNTVVVITGSSLKLKCLANNDLSVTGCIGSVSFE